MKLLLIKKITLSKLQVEHYKFKRNFSLFEALLNQKEKLSVVNYFPEELSFGNPKAVLELLLVTSPLCFYCKSAHRDIDKLLTKLDGKIKVVIRFNVDTSNKESTLYKVTSALLGIYHTHGESLALKAMNEVYAENVDLQKWLENQTEPLTKSYDFILNQQYNWSKSNSINFTPALFINNRPFPKEYNRGDLIYFIDELIEHQADSHNNNLVKQSIAS